MSAVDNVVYVLDTVADRVRFVYTELDWSAFAEGVVKESEILYFSIFYLVVKLLLGKISEPTRKAYLNPFLKVYNFGMVVYSFGTFLAMAKSVQEIPLYTDDCELAFRHDLFNLASKLFYYSKFVEYIDSFSLILAGKSVSFLQSFHHLGAPWEMYLLCVGKNESVWIMVILNSFVHTVMYFYYLLALFKIRVPLKFMITLLQIAQFNVGFYLVWWYKDVKCFNESPILMLGWIYSYWYVGCVLLLFINFSIWTYVFPSAPKKKTE